MKKNIVYVPVIDDIEIEDYLNEIFNDLQENAYDLDFHGYHYKQANQIIRKYFEEYASQFKLENILLSLNLLKIINNEKEFNK